METKLDDNNSKTLVNLKKSQTLEFIQDNIKINLSFLYNDKQLIFKVTYFSLPPYEYELSTSLENLYHINRYFNNFEKITELINSLIDSYNDKKLKIAFKENICILSIYNPIKKNTFELEIQNKEKNISSKIGELINIIKDDRKRIEALENKVAKLEKIISENNNKENKLFEESNILNDEEKKLIINWLGFKPKNINLLLNSKRDGDNKEAFHKLCDGKSPTIGIIETTKGHKFGGFTTKTWNGGINESNCIEDNNAFIFSLDTKKKYKVINSEKAIGTGKSWLLFFGYSDNSIVTYDKGCKNNNNYISRGAYNFDAKIENGGEYNFTMKSYEVYEIK